MLYFFSYLMVCCHRQENERFSDITFDVHFAKTVSGKVYHDRGCSHLQQTSADGPWSATSINLQYMHICNWQPGFSLPVSTGFT